MRMVIGAAAGLFLAFNSVGWTSVSGELDQAKSRGQVAFVLVTEPGAGGDGEAEAVIKGAIKKAGKAVLIRLDRTSAENAKLVGRYRLSGPQIPLVLVFAPNGVLAGGAVANGLNVDGLLGKVPTKKEVELITALQSGKGVLVLASCSGMAGRVEAIKACEKGCEMSSGKLYLISVDMNDQSEQKMLGKLRITATAGQPVTVVINSRGQIVGVFNGPVNPADLVTASVKTGGGGCCPGGKKAGAACPTPGK